jgi:EpsI family protein
MSLTSLFQLSKKTFAVLILLLLAAAMGNLLKPKAVIYEQNKFGLSENIPQSFGGWSVDTSVIPVVLDPSTAEAVTAIYSDTLSRTYVHTDGTRIMLSIAYGNQQTTKLKTHRQEVCYGSQGFTISELTHNKEKIRGVEIPATRLIATKGSRTEPLIYWFTMGDSVVQGHIERLFVQLKYAVSGEIPEGYLVRVSSISEDAGAAYSKQLEFLNELFAETPTFMVRRLIGHQQVLAESSR